MSLIKHNREEKSFLSLDEKNKPEILLRNINFVNSERELLSTKQ